MSKTKRTYQKKPLSDAVMNDLRRKREIAFMNAAAQNPNAKQATEMVAKQTLYEWMHDNGYALERHSQLREDIKERFQTSIHAIKQYETKLAKTKQYIQGVSGEDGKATSTPWVDWLMKDKVLLVFSLMCCGFAMVLGAANVFANLKGSGQAVFIESTGLTLCLSMILPLGSMAVKFSTNFMEFDKSRRWFSLGIYALTFLFLMIWIWIFADTYQGVSSAIDLDSLFSGDTGNSGLVYTQFLVEMLSGSALFLAAESIYLKYAPTHYVENHEYLEVKKGLKKHKDEHLTLRNQKAEIEAQIIVLEAGKQAEINFRETEFLAHRVKLQAANNPNFL